MAKDLFDMKVGGLGFHITAHMIAIAALFVACFAITGYITFRDESIPDSALKPGADDHDNITTLVDVPVAAATNNLDFTFTQPANTVIDAIYAIVTDSYTSATNELTLRLGTAAGGEQILAAADIEAAVGAVAVDTHRVYSPIATASVAVSSRTVHGRLVENTVTAAGQVKVVVSLRSL